MKRLAKAMTGELTALPGTMALFFGATVVAAPAATAAASDCPVGYSCGFQNTNFVKGNNPDGCMGWAYFQYSLSSLGCMNKRIKSVINKGTECNARWYENVNFGGPSILFQRGYQLQDMGAGNNKMSSGRFVC